MSNNELAQADKIFDNSERAEAALEELKNNRVNGDTKAVAALAQVPSHLTRCVDGRNALIETTQKLPNAQDLLKEFDAACQDRTGQNQTGHGQRIRLKCAGSGSTWKKPTSK